jgi:hypothetical protein
MARRARTRGVAVIVPTVERGERAGARGRSGARRADVWGWLRDNPAGERARLRVRHAQTRFDRTWRYELRARRGRSDAVFVLTVRWPVGWTPVVSFEATAPEGRDGIVRRIGEAVPDRDWRLRFADEASREAWEAHGLEFDTLLDAMVRGIKPLPRGRPYDVVL